MNVKGTGTVYFDKHHGKWFAKVPIGKTKSGLTAYKRKSASTKREAQLLRSALIVERDKEGVRKPASTLRIFATQHLQTEARLELKRRTLTDYTYNLERYVYPVFENTLLTSITSQDLSAFFSELRGKYSASVVNQVRTVMSRIFESALTHRIISDNPVRRTKAHRKGVGDKSKSKQPWDLEECRSALEASRGTSVETWLHLAVFTGMRMSEILGLMWGDIDLETGVLQVRRTLVEPQKQKGINRRDVLEFSTPKTKRSERTLSIGEPLIQALHRQQEWQRVAKENVGVNWIDTGLVITTKSGSPMYASNQGAQFRRFLKSEGLRSINPHSLRHSFAINSLSLGIDLASISRALGHASLQITLDIYARDSNNLQDAATEGLAKWFDSYQ